MWQINIRDYSRNFTQIKGIFYVIIILLQINTVYAQWNWINPYPQGNTLKSIQFVSSLIGYAAGDGGTVLKTTNGGQTWGRLNTGTLDDLNALFFTDTDTGYAVGENYEMEGFIIKTTDGGGSWFLLPGSYGYSNPLDAVYFTSADTGYISGYNYVYKTVDGGVTWQELNVPYNEYRAICFTSSQVGYIANYNDLSKTVDGGISWVILMLGKGNLYMSFPTENTGYVTGSYDTIYKTRNAGLTWTILHTGNFLRIQSLCFLDTLNGFAVGDSGKIMKTSDGGNSWTMVSIGLSKSWRSVSFADNLHGSVVGDFGSNVNTSNQGDSWSSMWGSVTLDTLTATNFPSKDVGYITGTMGTILKTTLSGNSWIKLISGDTHDLYSVSFVNDDYGFVTGESGTILKTIDGGSTWNNKSPGVNEPIYNVYFIDENTGYFTGWNNDVYKTVDGGDIWTLLPSPGFNCYGLCFTQSDTGYVVGTMGNGKKTTNGGYNWTLMNTETSNDLYNLHFINSKTGFIIGDKVILKSTDAGESWTEKYNGSLPITSLTFVDSLNGYALSAGYGQLPYFLITSDGGETWSPGNSIEITNYWLSQTIFTSIDTGFIIGYNGAILKTTTGGVLTNVVNKKLPQTISCYPNPADKRIFIPLLGSENSGVVKIIDIMGRIIYSESFHDRSYRFAIDASLFPMGIYQVVLISNKKTSLGKIIIVH